MIHADRRFHLVEVASVGQLVDDFMRWSMQLYVMDGKLSPSLFLGCRGQSYTIQLMHGFREGVMSIMGQ